MVEVSLLHELRVVVDEYLLLVDLQELLPHSLKDLPYAGIVREFQQAVVHIERRLVAEADLEAFFVPVDHRQLFLYLLYVSVDVRDLHLGASHDQPACQVTTTIHV